jgi:hypothetical protein
VGVRNLAAGDSDAIVEIHFVGANQSPTGFATTIR